MDSGIIFNNKGVIVFSDVSTNKISVCITSCLSSSDVVEIVLHCLVEIGFSVRKSDSSWKNIFSTGEHRSSYSISCEKTSIDNELILESIGSIGTVYIVGERGIIHAYESSICIYYRIYLRYIRLYVHISLFIISVVYIISVFEYNDSEFLV